MRWMVVVGMMVSTSSPAAAADGDAITDDHGFRLALGTTPRCVILPRGSQIPADCPGIDLTTAADNLEAQLGTKAPRDATALAVVKWKLSGDDGVFMVLVSMPAFPRTDGSVADYLAGVYNSVHAPDREVTRRSDPRLAHDEVTFAATPVIRYATDTSQGGTLVAYLVMGAQRSYAFQFMSPTPEDAAVRPWADGLVATMTLPPAIADGANTAYLTGAFLGAFLLTGILSRIFWRRYGRTFKAAFVGFGVAGPPAFLVGSVTMGLPRAIIYIAAAAAWLLIDLLRARPGER